MAEVLCPDCGNTCKWDESSGESFATCGKCGLAFDAQRELAQPSGPPPLDPRVAAAGFGAFVSPTPRSTLTSVFLIAVVVTGGVAIWSGFEQLAFLNRVSRFDRIIDRNLELSEEEIVEKLSKAGLLIDVEAEADANDLRQASVSLTHRAALIGMLITFLVWNYRAYKNLYALEAETIRFTPAGAVWWYFCPVANLWKPCQVMMDVWRGSGVPTKTGLSGFWDVLVPLWWVARIVDGVLAVVVSRMAEPDTIEGLVRATNLDIVSSGLGIASAAMTLLMVLAVTGRQNRRNSRITGPAESANPYEGPVVG